MARINAMGVKGQSGSEYTFDVFPLDESFRAIGGVYIVSRRYKNNAGETAHYFVYISATPDLSTVLNRHSKESSFNRYGANCICTLVREDKPARLTIANDLVKHHRTPCN